MGATPPAREEFFELDCLRGLAISLVFAVHAEGIVSGAHGVPREPSLWRSFIYGGHTGPTLFFVLSAFLLSRPFLAEFRGGRRVDVRNYFIRRALRIMPLYATAVLVAILVTATSVEDVLQGLRYLVFLNAVPYTVAPISPFSLAWWTVATEVEFYLMLPLLALAARSRRGYRVARRVFVWCVVLYAFLAFDWLPLEDPTRFALAHSVIGRGPAFLAGILAAAFYDRWGSALRALCVRHHRRARLVGDLLLVGALWALGALLQWIVSSGSYVVMETAWPTWRIAEGFLWAVVLLLLVAVPMHVKPLLANRMWALLGVISYSIYLVHAPLLIYGKGLINGWFPDVMHGWTAASAAAMLALAALSLALASLTYRLIERPALRRKTAVALWMRTPAVAGSTVGSLPPVHPAAAAGDLAWLVSARQHHRPSPADEL